MNLGPQMATDRAHPALAGQMLEVRWSAHIAPVPASAAGPRHRPALAAAKLEFVVALRAVDEHHALIEAWLETPAGLQNVLARQPASWRVVSDGHLLHVDAHLDGRRAVAVSLVAGRPEDGLLYARSPLLADAGFAPGAYDPPTARLVRTRPDVASA